MEFKKPLSGIAGNTSSFEHFLQAPEGSFSGLVAPAAEKWRLEAGDAFPLLSGLVLLVVTLCHDEPWIALLALMALGIFDSAALSHEAGYIGAMLFVIPGFPLITSGLDIAKMDFKSGIERLCYALTVILVATLFGWLVASIVHLAPDDFAPLGIAPAPLALMRAAMSFCGVFGFSIMFSSPVPMAATAGAIGAVANTLRLELVDLAAVPPEAAAFLGALAAGLIASAVRKKLTFPRISLTVPSIVIMVPGLYMYRAIFYLASYNIADSLTWMVRAALIVVFLPIGLAAARILTDRHWRYLS